MNKKDGIYWGDWYRIQRAEETRKKYEKLGVVHER